MSTAKQTKKTKQAETWTASDDARYSTLDRFFKDLDLEVHGYGDFFEEQSELVSLCDKASRCGVATDTLPW